MGKMFGGSEETQQQPTIETIYDPWASTRGKVQEQLNKLIGQKGPAYTGARIAELSPQELEYIKKAEEYANRPTGTAFNLAKDEITRVLSPGYDVSKSPFYQAVKAESARNLEETNKGIDVSAAAGRRFTGGAKIRARTDAATEQANRLNTLLTGAAQSDRARALEQASAYETTERGYSKDQLQTLAAAGILPRSIEQGKLSANYEDFLRTEQNYPLVILQLAMQLAGKEPTMIERQPAETKKTGGMDTQTMIQLAQLAKNRR